MKKIILLFIMISSVTFGQTFTDVTGSIDQLSFGFSTWGDFDNDGDLDLFYTGQLNANENGGGLYINDNGNFSLQENSNLLLLNTGAADSGDFNGDGYTDLIIIGADMPNYSGHADIFLNNGDGSFSPVNTDLPQCYMGDVKFADTDNDGDLDVIITGFDNSYVFFTKLYINNDGVLTEQTGVNLPQLNYGRIGLADYDNDGDTDITLEGFNNSTGSAYTKIWKNEGDNNFTEQDFGLPQLWLGDIEWGDVDNDGDLDLLYSGTAAANSEIHLFVNNGGNFTADADFNITPVHRGAGLELADFDGDGSLDIFLVGTNYSDNGEALVAKLYLNDGNGNYTEDNSNDMPGVEFCESRAADYDNDGKADIFYTGLDINGFALGKLYHNEGANSIQNQTQLQFEIYPNPVIDVLYIQPANNDYYSVQIINLTGQTVFQTNANTALNLNFSNYNKGIYFVKIMENNQTFVQKFIHK